MPASTTLSLYRRIPARALAISAAALAIPVIASIVIPDSYRQYTLLLWLLAIVPAFLLAYHRGWQGATLALAGGMAVLSTTQALLSYLGRELEDWSLLLAIVGIFTVLTLGIGLVTELLHRAWEEAAEMALTDELTGLPNRRYARLFLDKEFEAARRGRLLVVVLFDLDRFKDFNDQYGHNAGDDAIRSFAHALSMNTRKMNLSARFGGEEFISVVSSADVSGALVFVERVRNALAQAQPPRGHLTVSAGMAAYHPGMRSFDDLVAAADRALYVAKADGRNCVRVDGAAALPLQQQQAS